MPSNFFAGGDPPKIAIYTGAVDETLEADPYHEITRVKFHSDLPFVEAVIVHDGSVNLPLGNSSHYSAAQGHGVKINLFSHNLGFIPLVFGTMFDVLFYDSATDGFVTADVPMSGTFPMDNWSKNSGSAPFFYLGRLIELGADETNVFIWDRPTTWYSYTTPPQYYNNQPPERIYSYRVMVSGYQIV